jgi:hypothetical protein
MDGLLFSRRIVARLRTEELRPQAASAEAAARF